MTQLSMEKSNRVMCLTFRMLRESRRAGAVVGILAPLLWATQMPVLTAQSLAPVAASVVHYHPSQLGLQVRPIFSALGNRLSTPGNERLVLQGQLSQPSRTSALLNVAVTIDTTGALRVDSTSGQSFNVTFDGQQIGNSVVSSGLASASADQQLVDAFQYNSVEHFLAEAIQGNPVQLLGPSFRLSDPLNPANPPINCQAFRTVETSQQAWRATQQAKMYCFDASTHLLAATFYQATIASVKTYIETRYSGWHPTGAQSQMIPGRIEYRQNGVVQVLFTTQSAAVAPAATDGLFTVN